jgi:hypothetical protein
MKTNQMTRQRSQLSEYLRAGAIVTLLALSFAASISLYCNNLLAQSRGKRAESPAAQAQGKLVIDGKVTELKFAYARRDWSTSPLIDLIITNKQLSEGTVAEIVEGKYRGSEQLRGLWLIFDSSAAYKGERLLLQSGAVPAASGVVMSMMSANDKTRIENARIRGSLACKIESPARTTTFTVSFDAPIKLTPSEIGFTEEATNTEQLSKDFQNLLRGKWSIERWRSSSGHSFTGDLLVDGGLEDGKLRGLMHIVTVATGQKVDEEVTISREGIRVRMEGQVAPGTRWLPDTFILEFKNHLLVGSAGDQQGALGNVVLRKIP